MIYEPPVTPLTGNILPKGYRKQRALEKKLLAEDHSKRSCPVCSVSAVLQDHPRGEAFRCPKCKLVFGARPKAGPVTMNLGAFSVGLVLKQARKESHKRMSLKRQAEDYRDPVYHEMILERQKQHYRKNHP